MFTTLMDNVHRFKKHWPWFFHLKNITTITTRQQNKEIACSKGDYVLAAYDRSCYIGNVLEDDVSDKTLHIAFMVVKRFHWPNKQDTLWINSKYIIRKIQHPIATGKGGPLFRVSEDVMEFIETYNSN